MFASLIFCRLVPISNTVFSIFFLITSGYSPDWFTGARHANFCHYSLFTKSAGSDTCTGVDIHENTIPAIYYQIPGCIMHNKTP